jgi:hypothetical protein
MRVSDSSKDAKMTAITKQRCFICLNSRFVDHSSWSEYDDGDGNGCDFPGGDEDTWYMGLSSCYRANTAYALYGILKGEEDTGCNSKTFINSFVTTRGIEYFTEYMQYAGVAFTSAGDDDGNGAGVTSECQADGGDDGGDDAAGDDGNAVQYSHNGQINGEYSSSAVGCSGLSYVQKTFPGLYCTEVASATVSDELISFNNDMDKIQCLSIYKSSGNDNNDGGSPLEALTVSRSCSVLEYPKSCPDPYGKLIKYERRLEDSTGFVHSQRKERFRKIVSWILLILGLLLLGLVASVASVYGKSKDQKAKPPKKLGFWQRITQFFRRKKKTAPSGSSS